MRYDVISSAHREKSGLTEPYLSSCTEMRYFAGDILGWNGVLSIFAETNFYTMKKLNEELLKLKSTELLSIEHSLEGTIEKSYQLGYDDGFKAAMAFIRERIGDLITVNKRCWAKYNFGACKSSGSAFDEDFKGSIMNYDESTQLCELYGFRLPTLKEIRALVFSGAVNVSSTGNWWNPIAISNGIVFPVGADIWVSDEEDDDEYATIVGFSLYDIKREYYSLHTASVRIETKKVKKTERNFLHPILK